MATERLPFACHQPTLLSGIWSSGPGWQSSLVDHPKRDSRRYASMGIGQDTQPDWARNRLEQRVGDATLCTKRKALIYGWLPESSVRPVRSASNLLGS